MKVVSDFPPNYRDIVDALGDVTAHQPIFCYGETIYNPFGRTVTEDLQAHERAHSTRQRGKPDIWWMQYLYDAQFRLQEEIIGYGAQYAYAKSKGVHGKVLEWALDHMARSLSGPLYGHIISWNDAKCKIKNHGNKKN